MVGTRQGALKTGKSNKERHGDDFYQKIGKMGGSCCNSKKGFGSNPALARLAGRKGGLHRWTKKESQN